MTKRNSTKDRRDCFDQNKFVDGGSKPYLRCHICKRILDPTRDKWVADHVGKLHAWGGTVTMPACVPCHKEKSKCDTTAVAKAKRGREKELGIRVSKTPMPGGRDQRIKRKMNGGYQDRETGLVYETFSDILQAIRSEQ